MNLYCCVCRIQLEGRVPQYVTEKRYIRVCFEERVGASRQPYILLAPKGGRSFLIVKAQRMSHNEVRLELKVAGCLLSVVLEPMSLLICVVVIADRRSE